MKKILIVMPVLLAWTVSLSAQITREQANAILLNHLQGLTQPYDLYYNSNLPSEGAPIAVTTSNGETFRVKYACWAYFLNESAQRRYLFVKEDGGSLLEVIASNDQSELDNAWLAMDNIPAGLSGSKGNSLKQLYPNPVGDVLTLPCHGENTRVEIYDLKGARLFSGLLSGEDACQLNVSFLNAGVYTVTASGEMYKIIKNKN